MEVILLERIEKLGAIGDLVKVKNGYARNFLLPNGKALRANEANRKVFEANRERIEAQNAERRGEAETESKQIDGVRIQLIRQASNAGQLYGSVSARDIAEALEAGGHKVAKNHIVLDRPIKAIGLHDVKVSLHPEVSVVIHLNVARSPEEAELQAQGVDVMADMFEKDVAGFTEDFDPNAEPGEIAAASEQAPTAEEASAREEGPVDEEAEEAVAEEDPAAEEAPAEEPAAEEASAEEPAAEEASAAEEAASTDEAPAEDEAASANEAPASGEEGEKPEQA